MRPNALDQLGLEAALSHAAREFTDRSGVGVKLACVTLVGRLPPDHELTLYRIMQEALRNVEKHAHARTVAFTSLMSGNLALIVVNRSWRSSALARLRTKRRLIISAHTGSGKSTQVPQMLLDHGLLGEGQAVVLQPRRLATRMLAARVASERKAELGSEVGYQIRLENVTAPHTITPMNTT